MKTIIFSLFVVLVLISSGNALENSSTLYPSECNICELMIDTIDFEYWTSPAWNDASARRIEKGLNFFCTSIKHLRNVSAKDRQTCTYLVKHFEDILREVKLYNETAAYKIICKEHFSCIPNPKFKKIRLELWNVHHIKKLLSRLVKNMLISGRYMLFVS